MIQEAGDRTTTQLALRIWHPNCWTLRTTKQANAGLIGHSVYQVNDEVTARLTAYGDTKRDINSLVNEIRGSEWTKCVELVHEYFGPSANMAAAGNATQELLVKYRSEYSIHDAFVSRGFIPEEAVRIHDGYEYWPVIISESRPTVQSLLDEIRCEMDAEISVEGVKSSITESTHQIPVESLSERQREVLELAKRHGYYNWPREANGSELAEKLDISKTTFHEHLRKAEAKLLGND